MRFYPLTYAGRIRHISRFLEASSLYSLLDHLTYLLQTLQTKIRLLLSSATMVVCMIKLATDVSINT